MQKSNNLQNSNILNYAISLQIDHQGRIYQDAYRKVFFQCTNIDKFQDFMWNVITQFIFTIRWEIKPHPIATFIAQSVGSYKNSIKPFRHCLSCQLADSINSNFFEAISLVSQQYKHHYNFRSLKQTGNSIIIVSAGNCKYQTDHTTYKMAKSYIYLTNINCQLVNLSGHYDHITAIINKLNHQPIYNPTNSHKLKKLINWCFEEEIYRSPIYEHVEIIETFSSKSCIYPQDIKPIKEADIKSLPKFISTHKCKKEHYYLTSSGKPTIKTTKTKTIEWISCFFLSDELLYVHELFYTTFDLKFLKNKHIQHSKLTEYQIFENDLSTITLNKQDWFHISISHDANHQLQTKIQSYIEKVATLSDEDLNKLRIQNQLNATLLELQTLKARDQQDGINEKKNGGAVEQPHRISEKVNIFQATWTNKEYHALKMASQKNRKTLSHNKERLRNCFANANIAYLMNSFNDNILSKLSSFFHKSPQQISGNPQQLKMEHAFKTQKFWKNICFPILTPIYTRYQENIIDKAHYEVGEISKDSSQLQNALTKFLMENYQIKEGPTINEIKLSKGHIHCRIRINQPNFNVSYVIDSVRQNKIIPFQLYRYLCYEEKDYRFCRKFIYFQDKNFCQKNINKIQQTKRIKIALICDAQRDYKREKDNGIINISSRKNCIQDFIRMMNSKYQQQQLHMVVTQNEPNQVSPIKNYDNFKLLKKTDKHSLYKFQSVSLTLDTKYNPNNLYKIIVSWNFCSAYLVNEFIQTVRSFSHRSKMKSFLISPENVFKRSWSMQTLGQIIMKSKRSIQMLQILVQKNQEWYWDSYDFYFYFKGTAFIRFERDKLLILWYDNLHQRKYRHQTQNQEYFNFFMKAAAIEIIADIVDKAAVVIYNKIENKKKGISTKMQMTIDQ